MPSSPGASRRAPPPPPRMSASSVSRPERGSTAWKTSAGNDTWLAATERSGSSSHSPSISTSVSRWTARWRALERRREGRIEQAALRSDYAHAAGQAGVLGNGRPEEGADGEVGAGVACSRSARSCPMAPAPSCPSESTTSVPSSTETTACTRIGGVSSKPLVVHEPLDRRPSGRAMPRNAASRAAGGRLQQRLHCRRSPWPGRARRRARRRASCRGGRPRAARRGRPASTPGRGRWRRSARTAHGRGAPPSTSRSAGEDQPLLEQLRALGALRAREPAADVDVVGDRAGPGHQRAVAEERA